MTQETGSNNQAGNPVVQSAENPVVHRPEKTSANRTIDLYLVASSDERACHFWVGLATAGELSPSALMDLDDLPEVFVKAATQGLKECGPVMLSNSDRDPPRYVYLSPIPAPEFRERTIWIHDLVTTIKAWAPSSVGFYLAPELLQTKGSHDLLLQILRELIQTSKTGEFCLLLGSHGMNSVLNAALRLRSELETKSVTLNVFH